MEKILYVLVPVLVGLYVYGFVVGAAISPIEIIFFIVTAGLLFRYYLKRKEIN